MLPNGRESSHGRRCNRKAQLILGRPDPVEWARFTLEDLWQPVEENSHQRVRRSWFDRHLSYGQKVRLIRRPAIQRESWAFSKRFRLQSQFIGMASPGFPRS